ncbi:MAG: hypothetical protein IH872_06575 [Chloroflexi bacterium]|nr:hypothetical protein [Chloroflexota bacterium]
MSFPSPERPRAWSSRLPPPTANDGPPSPAVSEDEFGSGSPVFAQTADRLSRIFDRAVHTPPVAARFGEWQRCWNSVHGHEAAGEYLFVHHTYLALLARLIARRFVAPRRPVSGAEELLEVINADYFSRRGIGNFGEGDIFSWLPLEPRWELDLNDLVLETVQGLADALAPHDFTNASPGILDGLYRQTAPASLTVPRWLAEYVVEDELGLADDPGLSMFDPACGTGTFLCAAIGTMKRSGAQRGGDPVDVLFDAPEKIRGLDRDPLAVALSRLNYLLALGGQLQQNHPPFLLPVYLADADKAPETQSKASDEPFLTLTTTAGDFPLPEPFISDPMMLDWVLGRLTNYMDGAQMRLHAQSEDVAVQEVLNAYYNYLTAGKPRTPVPDALTPKDADILLETARSLVHLHIRGEGTLWLHLVQNLAAPAIFSRLGFDRMAGHGGAAFFETTSRLYLRPEGRAAMVTSMADATSESAFVVTGPDRRVRLRIEGGPFSQDSSWADAKADVRVTEEA